MKTVTSKQFGMMAWLILLMFSTNCQFTPAFEPTSVATTLPSTSRVESTATLETVLPSSKATPSPTIVTADPSDTIREVTILYTNDEHGWMEGMDPGRGAANLLSVWRQVEGYSQDGPFLILSGGDMWTGPAISTWFEGESMVELMNEMGYDAVAIGNHEFDFGLEVLRQRINESTFPYLSANTRYANSGETLTELGVLPYTVIEVNDIQIGLIGLTTTSTPRTTNPVNVAEFEFIDYEAALRQAVPHVEAAGADLILAPGHVCMYELEPLAQKIGDLGIDMLGGGHCNELVAQEINGIVLLEGGFHLTAYAHATFKVDIETNTVVGLDYGVALNKGGIIDTGIDSLVMRWQDEAETELNVVIGFTANKIPHRSQVLQDLVIDSWLIGYPAADIAITNLGGFRAPIPPGEITLADVVGVMPFDNTIIEVQLTGTQILNVIAAGERPVVGGMSFENGRWILDKSSEPIDTDTVYSVLVNSFMYAGGSNYDRLAEYDPRGYDTTIHYRQPFIDWIMTQNSSPDDPLLNDD